ncbi:MAG: hypothetical protein AAF937_09420 [Planctomycetota bacterium]
MTSVIQTIVAFWNAIPQFVSSLLARIWELVAVGVNWVWQEVLGYSTSLIAPSWQADMTQVMQYIDPITYLFPVYQTLAIVGVTYAAVFSIRATRWLLACIPTLSLG